jgi:threonine dehydratase
MPLSTSPRPSRARGADVYAIRVGVGRRSRAPDHAANAVYAWPLLRERTGHEIWVKHENHTPIGAFKVRGGLTYLDALVKSGRKVTGLISATRGNHGQSIAFAGARYGIPVTIVVPRGNNPEKNAAMQALGGELVVHGQDFDEARQEAKRLAETRGLELVPSFDSKLVVGVATYALELFRAVPDLDTVYVPIGMGSGICGTILARDLLGLKTRVVGVSAANAPANALSFTAGRPVATNSAATFADGLATRDPNPRAVEIFSKGADTVLSVTEDEMAEAIRLLYETTHNLVEGAGAAPLAALIKTRERSRDGKHAVVLSGGNIDRPSMAEVLSGRTPIV